MVALKTQDIEAFVARPDPARPVILVFGPDAGLVHERAEKLIQSAVDDVKDPFALARLEGDEVAGEPSRLVEEANTIPLFGGRRAVWVKAGGRNLVPAVEMLLAATSPDCRVVIEAGDLKRNAPLRALCERAKNAAAIPCYLDGARDLARIIDEEMREANLTLSREARAEIISLLGGDRAASRSELRKLALYAHGRGQVEIEDVRAIMGGGAQTTFDGVSDAAFAGRTSELELEYDRARAAGTSPGTILFAALRQVAQLHKLHLAIDGGQSLESVTDRLHFARKPLIQSALRVWSSSRLVRVMAQLSDAMLETRRQSAMADAITHRALLSIAVMAKRRD